MEHLQHKQTCMRNLVTIGRKYGTHNHLGAYTLIKVQNGAENRKKNDCDMNELPATQANFYTTFGMNRLVFLTYLIAL